MNRELPLVEIFILNYNGGRFLVPVLESLLAQTYPNKHIILSDNGSTDDSAARAETAASGRFELRKRRPGTGCLYTHYNLCISETKAMYVLYSHADDVYEPTFLEEQISFLESNRNIDLVFSAGTAIDSNDRVMWPIRPPSGLQMPRLNPQQVFDEVLKHGNGFLICPSVVFRASVFHEMGVFQITNSADLEFWLRCLSKDVGVAFNEKSLIRYRLTTGQMSAQYDETRTSSSDFQSIVESYARNPGALGSPSEEAQNAYETLKQLDALHVALNRLARAKANPEELTKALRGLQAGATNNLGMVDRLKVRLVTALGPLLRGPKTAPACARFILKMTEPRTNRLLALAVKAYRGLKSI